MALSRVKTWVSEVLSASDLNAEFNNILNNALSLISPLTGDLDANAKNISGLGYVNLSEIAAPANPAADTLRLYAVDNAARTRLAYRDSGGLVNLLGGLNLDTASTAEATTVSVGAVDLKVITLVNSCPVGDGLLLIYSFRKSSGAAVQPQLGLKVNATQVFSNAATFFSANSQAESGMMVIILGSQIANYLSSALGLYTAPAAAVGSGTFTVSSINVMPNATITSLTITGAAINAAVTLGVAEAVVYRMSHI